MQRPRIVVVGGGFAGLEVARGLEGAFVELTVIDRRNHHLFQPLLYQVATGGLSPADVSAPIRSLLSRQSNCAVRLDEVTGVDVGARRLRLADTEMPYDTLVIATGVRHAYFGREEWELHAPGLKTIEDATEIRRRVLTAFEAAERLESDRLRRPWLRFVIVGAGPTGVELAGSLAEMARHTLPGDFRTFDTATAEIVLVEGGPRILPSYDAVLAASAARALVELGVSLRTLTLATEITEHAITLRTGDTEEVLEARTVLWAAGIASSPLLRTIAAVTGAGLDDLGRLRVGSDLTVPGHPEIYVAGDAACFCHHGEEPLRGTADVAQAEGRYIARHLRRRLDGRRTPSFQFRDRGKLAVIGRSRAVAQLPGFRFSGRTAWLFWLFLHLMKLVTFQNRFTVLLQWGWSFVTRDRSARLITRREWPDPPIQRSS